MRPHIALICVLLTAYFPLFGDSLFLAHADTKLHSYHFVAQACQTHHLPLLKISPPLRRPHVSINTRSVAFNYIRRRNLLEVALVRTATAAANPAVLAASSGGKAPPDLSDINPDSGWPGSLPIRVQVTPPCGNRRFCRSFYETFFKLPFWSERHLKSSST